MYDASVLIGGRCSIFLVLFVFILKFVSLFPRQHTTAFVPSSGRIYSFGLGGNGQLGTGTTSNRKSPFTVKGNWLSYSEASNPPTTGKCVMLNAYSFDFCSV